MMAEAPHHDGPIQLRASLDTWAKAAGLSSMPITDGEASATDQSAMPVRVRHLGWRNAKSEGRGGDGLTVLNDMLVMVADLSDDALSTLARLYEMASATLIECGPVAPDDELWTAMGLSPRPALRATLQMQIRSAAEAAPRATERRVTIGSMRPLSGRVTWGGHSLSDVLVSSGSSHSGVKTDASGTFRLAHVESDELVLRKGAREMRRPLTGETTMLIDLQKDI